MNVMSFVFEKLQEKFSHFVVFCVKRCMSKTKIKRHQFVFTEEVDELIRKHSAETGLSLTMIVTQAVIKFIKEKSK